ncbi:MAG: AI-2E family transporter [Epsilonproteobacteria bacterium]|nr:AI-2E family transporter [Campylobacterota bacterium]
MIQSNTFVNLLFLIVSYFMYVTYQPFLIDIVIAVLLSIALFNIEKFFFERYHNKYISSTIITVFLIILLFTPLFYFISKAAIVIQHITPTSIEMVVSKAKHLVAYLPDVVAEKLQQLLASNSIQTFYQNVAKFIGSLTAKSAFFLKDMLLIIIFFFFINLYGKDILGFIKKILPLEQTKANILFSDTQAMMGLVFYSTLATAVLEGILFGGFVYFYGFDGLFFTIMYAFASLIPVIGGAIMWIPMSLYLYAQGDIHASIEIALYSIIVISIIADTFIKPLIIQFIKTKLNNSIQLNPLLVFFSIVAGLSTFGFWGVILGPAITSLFISILKFYDNE